MGELTRNGQSRPVMQEELDLYSQAQRMQVLQQVPVLQRGGNPHEYLYLALLDGTGQDLSNAGQLPTNIGHLSRQADLLARDPKNRIGYTYVEGIGTHGLLRLYDGYRPFTWDEKTEEAYRALANRTKEWKLHDPEAQIRIAHVGYSRGAVLAAGLARLVDRYGIADPEDLKFGRDPHGNITVVTPRPVLVKPGQTAQAMGLFDPVATNMPDNYDARLAPSVISAYSQLAINERRVAFPHQAILDAELTTDARFLRTPLPGGHSNVGGGNRESGLETAAFNGMVDYLNGLRDKPLFAYRTLPDEPTAYTVYQARGVTAVPGLDRDGVRNEREDLANCRIVDPCRDAEAIDETLAGRFEYRQLKPMAPIPMLSDAPVATQDARAAVEAATPDQAGHPQHRLLQQIRGQVQEREREGMIQFRDDQERERFCRYALAACKDDREELRELYPDRDLGSRALTNDGIVRADHVVIGSKQYAFVVQGDLHDPAGERVAFTMDRARQTAVEESDLKLRHANQEIAQHKELFRHQEPTRTPEEAMTLALVR